MRVCIALRIAALLTVPLFFAFHAAAKDKPAPDWAVEASKAALPDEFKSAKAVVLMDEYLLTVDANRHAVERERQATRILTALGRSDSHFAVSYDVDEKLNYFRCWTLAGDGKQFEAKETDFVEHGSGHSSVEQSTDHVRVINPPAGDPGAVVACESEKVLAPYISEEIVGVHEDIPVLSRSLELALAPGLKYSFTTHRLAIDKPVELADGHLRWTVKNVPALDLDTLRVIPSRSALTGRLSVKWGETVQGSIEEQWRSIGQWANKLQEHRTDSVPEIDAKVRELVAGAPDLYVRLQRITAYVQKNIQYFIVTKGIGGWQAHFAKDIFRNRYGDCKDKTTLLIAMLQAAGIKAHLVVVDSRRGVVDPEAPSIAANHMIAAIELPAAELDPRLAARVKLADGTTLLIFDPADQETPVGLLPSGLQGGYGFMGDGDRSQLLHLPVLAPEFGGATRKGSFTLLPDGSLQGQVTESFIGDDAGYRRWFLKMTESAKVRERLEQSVGSEVAALSFKDYEYRGAADLDQPLELDLRFEAANYLRRSGTLQLFRPRVFGSHALAATDILAGKERIYPIEMGYTGRWTDHFEFTLPEGYVVDEMPGQVDLDLDFASYHAKMTATGKTLLYEREYVVREVELPASKAKELRRLENVIMADEKGMAVLKKL